MLDPIVCGIVKDPETLEITDLGTGKDFEAEVVVYNCDCHTYQQVVSLFCQVIPGMTPKKPLNWPGRLITTEVQLSFRVILKTLM